MKKLFTIFVFILFLIGNISAQSKTTLLINTGFSIPSSEDFSDYWSASYNLGVGMEFPVNSQLSILGYIDYNSFSFNEEDVKKALFITDYRGEGGAIHALCISANAKYYLSDKAQSFLPYIIGGLGYSNISVSDLKVSYRYGSETITVKSEGALNFNFGVGGQYSITANIYLFADLKYNICFTNDKVINITEANKYGSGNETFSLTEDLSYLPLRIGVIYSF